MNAVRRLDRQHFIQSLRIAPQFLQPIYQLLWLNPNPVGSEPLKNGGPITDVGSNTRLEQFYAHARDAFHGRFLRLNKFRCKPRNAALRGGNPNCLKYLAQQHRSAAVIKAGHSVVNEGRLPL